MIFKRHFKLTLLEVPFCLATIGSLSPSPSIPRHIRQPGLQPLALSGKTGLRTDDRQLDLRVSISRLLVVLGPHRRTFYRSAPQYLDILEYTEAELSQEIAGLEQGSWLKSNHNYKQVTIDGLSPGMHYRYFTCKTANSFRGIFNTPPTSDRWRHLRVVAFADTVHRTKGASRYQNREWELHPIKGYTDESPTTWRRYIALCRPTARLCATV